MKKIIYTYILVLYSCLLFSQKYDNVWLFGKDSQTNPIYAGSIIDFNTIPPDVYYEYRNMNFRQANTSMCDTSGNLLFYTNGSYIANALGDTIQNCYGINPGPAQEEFQDHGYILDQGVLALPKPGSDSLYYLFHLDQIMPYSSPIYGSRHFYYTLIDMSKNGGLGRVEQENNLILEDDLASGKLTAVKHANGIDWWMLVRRYDSNEYYTFLLTEDGIEEHGIQKVGEPIPTHGGVGQSVFSPDGTKYVKLNLVNGVTNDDYVNIYDFDRCRGQLSNHISIAYLDSAWVGGVAISPNSRFLYVASDDYLYQYDFWADDLEASRDTVGVIDDWHLEGFPDWWGASFSLMQLAPDGKIYIASTPTIPYLHTIDYPDLKGDSCGVCLRCVELPTFNAFSMPNFPNYRLGAAAEPCEPDATVEVSGKDARVSVFPNPAEETTTVSLADGEWRSAVVVLYDVTGREVLRQALSGRNTEIGLGGLAQGLYFWEVRRAGGFVWSGRLVRM